jgi:hypothetical protein
VALVENRVVWSEAYRVTLALACFGPSGNRSRTSKLSLCDQKAEERLKFPWRFPYARTNARDFPEICCTTTTDTVRRFDSGKLDRDEPRDAEGRGREDGERQKEYRGCRALIEQTAPFRFASEKKRLRWQAMSDLFDLSIVPEIEFRPRLIFLSVHEEFTSMLTG